MILALMRHQTQPMLRNSLQTVAESTWYSLCPCLLVMNKGLDPGLVTTKYGVITLYRVVVYTLTCDVAIRSHGVGKP
jgi:hypothetical protein